jgi:probable HAF family extracellular repeat protein
MFKFKPTTMAVLLAAGLAQGNTAQAELRYRIKDLGTLGGRLDPSYGTGLNAYGQVVGQAYIAGPYLRAFITNSRGKTVDLGALEGGFESYGSGINDSGQITGWAQIADGRQHAFVTNNSGKMIDLGTLGGAESAGGGINDSGQVTGWTQIADGRKHAFVTDKNGIMIDLGTLGGDTSSGTGINASGQVTGSADTIVGVYGRSHPFITDSIGKMIDLGTLGGFSGTGSSINASGQVAGSAQTANSRLHAFVTNSNGIMIDLGTLGGNSSFGNSINDSGQIVGDADTVDDTATDAVDGRPHGFVSDHGVMRDLNTLLVPSATGWVINSATGINDSGQITGTGIHKGLTHAFLLNPINIANKANGDSVKLSESQKDEVKCGPITKEPMSQSKSQACGQNTTVTYTMTTKLTAATVAANGISIADLNADTQINIAIDTFAFSGSLATADLNKSKLSPAVLPGTWTQQHPVCLKPIPDAGCAKSKQVTDGTVKISTDSKKGLTLILSGKKSVVEGNVMGQQIYADLCKANASSKSPLIEKATISIGEKTIPMPLKITCSVKKTTKKPVYSTTGPFELINMAIKAELALTQ